MATEIPVKNAGTESAKIQKVSVTLPAPFKEGHKLRANEAEALNAYYVNCIRNAIAPDVKEMLQKAGAVDDKGNVDTSKVDVKSVQKLVDEFVQDYDFGQTGGRGGDPVEREAMEIARNSVRNAIRKKGYNVSDYSAKQISQKARELLQSEKHGAVIRQKAEQIVSQREELGDIDI